MKKLIVFFALSAFLIILANPAVAILVIQDQSDAATTMTGLWYDQSVSYPETELWVNDNSKWAYGDDTGGTVFNWNISGLSNGLYYAYASWANNGDGTFDAIYSGLDGGDVLIDQRIYPGSTTYNDVPYGYLGEVTVSGGTATISLRSDHNYAYADSIALDSDNPPPVTSYIINDQDDPGNTMTGDWTLQGVSYPATELWFNADCRWAYGDDTGNTVFTWNYSGLNNGLYYAYASWANNGDGSREAIYSGLDGDDVTINQAIPPLTTSYEGLPCGYLGEVTVTDGTAAISLRSDYSYPYADAVILDPDNAPPPEKEFIVNDQGDPGNTSTGTWTYQPVTHPSSEFWINDDSVWAYGDETGNTVFTWNFSGLDNGTYEVYTSWANSGDGSSDSVYSGLDGGDVTVNQKTFPNSAVIEGVPFGYLGEVTVTDGTTAISLWSASNYPYADAIALCALESTVTPGDANKDGYVDVSDLGILATNYDAGGGFAWEDGDFTGDGFVDVSDLGILATYYGTTPAAQAIPEPSTFAGLLGLCLVGLLTSVRRRSS